MRIKVEWQDISKGKTCDSDLCPIALAIKRVLPASWKAFVGATDVVLFGPNDRLGSDRADLPREAKDFIVAFDKNHPGSSDLPAEPFSFDLLVNEKTFAAYQRKNGGD